MEKPLQRHLEAHPWLLKGLDFLDDTVVISELPLDGEHRADFAWLRCMSNGNVLHFVEIERACLPVFTKRDEFTSEFNHALMQAADWSGWFERNIEGIQEVLEPAHLNGWWNTLSFRRCYVHIIVGRRANLSNARRQERWGKKVDDLLRVRVQLRTWDGFLASIPVKHMKDESCFDVSCIAYSLARKTVRDRT